MGDTNGFAHEAAFDLKDEPVENLRRMKVRVIGAGFSGILAAIRYVCHDEITASTLFPLVDC